MTDSTKKPIRSPSYPSMSLRDAVTAVGKIENEYRASPVDRTVAAKLIGYTALSGPANKALAALATYGLLERAGKGETRVTNRARAILHADSERERVENLLAAASEPALFRELRERFEDVPVPPEEGVITYLKRQGFNPTAVKPAAKAFLQTMEYVEELGETESHGEEAGNGAESNLPEDNSVRHGGAKVGDLIQWESDGAFQFRKSARVRAVTDDGEWVFVEGSKTGIPMAEVIVDKSGAGGGPAHRQPPRLPLHETSFEGADIGDGDGSPAERVIYREEGMPGQYLKLVASGDLDEYLLDAVADFVKRQRKRLGLKFPEK